MLNYSLQMCFKLPGDQRKCSLFNEENGSVQVTLLQKAAIFGLTDYVDLLYDCTILDKKSVTPIHLACYFGYFDMVKHLIEQKVCF